MHTPPVTFGRHGGLRHISGRLEGLAAGATAIVVFDLAKDPGGNVVDAAITLSVSVPGGTGNVTAYMGDTPTPATDRPVADSTGSLFKARPLVSGEFVGIAMVIGRYLYLTVTNTGGSPFPANATVAFAAYRG